ncbi:ribonuclease H-like domain-containing protein [Tanacetum coccineum]
MPSPSVSTFTFPSTTEPVFSASTSEPVFESPNHTQTSQTTQSQQLQQYHTTTVSNNNAKFPYLKKEEYETWAMKMEYWIMNSDHNLWNIVLNGNSRKRTGRNPKGNIMILPPIFVKENIAVQRETKARTILLQSLPEDHMADFHHLDDARDIWLAVKARFGGNDESKKIRKSMLKQEFLEFKVSESEGLHKGYGSFQKILSQLNQMQAKPDNEDYNMKFLRALPPSWSQVAITLKTKGGLDYLSFDDLYNKLRTLEIDVKGGSSYDSRGTSAPTHSAFISAASTNPKMSYADSQNQSPSITFTIASSSTDTSSNVIESVLHSFIAESDPQQQITYEDFDQIGKLDLEELDIKWQMAMECSGKQLDPKARYSSFKLKELDKTEKPKALLSVNSMLNWSGHEGKDVENGAAQVYGMIARAEEDATGDTTGDVADAVSNAAAEFALMGISSQVKLEESNARFDKWKESSKNLVKLINSSMSSRSRFGLGFGDTFGSDEVCVRTVGMHAVPPPITRTFMPPSNKPDLDDTQFTYGSKSTNNFETNSVSNDFVSCDNSDKSSDSETTDFASPVNIGMHNKTYGGTNVVDIPSFVPKAASVPAGSRNGPASVSAGSRNRQTSVPAGSRNRPASVPAGRPFTAGWKNLEEGNCWLRSPQQRYNMTFGGGDGKITGKGTIRTSKLNFENVYYVEELQNFNLKRGFQLPEISQVVPRIPRRHNLYCFSLSDIQPARDSPGIRRDYSNARTPQQNGVAERKNRTLIEAARTMLADSKLPTMFWTEAVSNWLVMFFEQGLGHEWYFDLDYLTDSLGYTRFKASQLTGTQDTNIHAGTKVNETSDRWRAFRLCKRTLLGLHSKQ